MPRIYQLGVSLPDGPLEEFRASVANLPQSTEAERLVIQRVGQDIFRDRLITYWRGRCPLTGITDPALLRASHHCLEGLHQRCRPAGRAQWSPAFGIVGRGIRPGARDLR